MEVLPHDTRADECGQLGSRAAAGLSQVCSRIVARSRVTGFPPNLADLYRCAIRRAVRVGVCHVTESRTEDGWSALRTLPGVYTSKIETEERLNRPSVNLPRDQFRDS